MRQLSDTAKVKYPKFSQHLATEIDHTAVETSVVGDTGPKIWLLIAKFEKESFMSKRDTYDAISRLNHWIIAAAIVGMLCFGLYLGYGGLANEAKGPLISIHKSIGVLVLIFGLWRVIWRVVQGFPTGVSGMPRWQEKAARAAHWALLAGIMIMPLSGTMSSIYGGRAIEVFGWFTIPAQAEVSWLSNLGGVVHNYVGIGLSVLVVLHLAAALKHHFVDRDSTLVRMVSGQHDQPNE